MPSCLACFLPKQPIFRLMAKVLVSDSTTTVGGMGLEVVNGHLFCTGIGKANYWQ